MSSDKDHDSASSSEERDVLDHKFESVDDSESSSTCSCGDLDLNSVDGECSISSPNNGNWSDLEHDPEVLDIIIIGAGPSGLAAAARIREQAPAAMFTDEEHRRWVWLKKHGKRLAIKVAKTGEVIPAKSDNESKYTMAVLDATADSWLGSWKDRFATFDIRHLRSPMIWHVDPQDRDSLLRHAEKNGTKNDRIEIRGCVGKEKSKYQQKQAKFSGGS